MTVQIEVSPEAARMIEALRSHAKALNLTLEAYLQRIIEAVALLQSNGQRATSPPRQNTAMLEALESTREILKDMPVRGSTEESLNMLREGRAGRMWGYDSAE